MDCNKVHQNRVLEYLEMVDECNSLLRGIKVTMDRCEREDGDINRHLRSFCKVVDRIRVLEGDMVGALKYFKQLEQDENLELIKVGFEEILEKDMDCNKVHQNRVLEYLEMVDECNSLLRGIKVTMDRCEREDGDINRHLRSFCKVVDRIRVLEGDMVGALKYFKQLEQ
ncbi:hypothetical protein RYX36_006928, partial [Vicia faba]